MKKVFLSTLFFCLSLSIFIMAAEKPGMIVLLNGTSSAGKSTVIKELQKIYGNKFEVASIDEFMIKHDKGQYNKKYVDLFYAHVKKLSQSGKNILVDAIVYENEYTQYIPFLGPQTIKILLYCPVNKLVEHVILRNKVQNQYEQRILQLVLLQFIELYNSSTLIDEHVIDQMDKVQLNHVLKKSEKQAHEDKVIVKHHKKLVKDFTKYFDFNKSGKVGLAPKNEYDLVVNTGTDSPRDAACKIAEFLETKI